MAEGGQYPWNRQVIDRHRGPACSYEEIRKSLPRPPAGQLWVQDLKTKEWTLEAGSVVACPTNDDNNNCNQATNNPPSSLPKPPKGKRWVQVMENEKCEYAATQNNNNNEWHLVDCDDEKEDKECTEGQQEQRKFLEHKVCPSDTFQGLCLRYKITPTELRQSNRGFSGTNLLLAPDPLRIPLPLIGNIAIRVFDVYNGNINSANDKPSMVKKLQKACGYGLNCASNSKLALSEARCYLELNDWNYEEALKNAKEDLAMEKATMEKATKIQAHQKIPKIKKNCFFFC